jgi:hypothetical protein
MFLSRRHNVSVYNLQRWKAGWQINWRGFGRDRSRCNRGTTPAEAWRDWAKPLKSRVKIIVTFGIRKENLPSTSLERDCYASPTANDDRGAWNLWNRLGMRGCQRDGWGDNSFPGYLYVWSCRNVPVSRGNLTLPSSQHKIEEGWSETSVCINIHDLFFHPVDRDSMYVRYVKIFPKNKKLSLFYNEDGGHSLHQNTDTNLYNYAAS